MTITFPITPGSANGRRIMPDRDQAAAIESPAPHPLSMWLRGPRVSQARKSRRTGDPAATLGADRGHADRGHADRGHAARGHAARDRGPIQVDASSTLWDKVCGCAHC